MFTIDQVGKRPISKRCDECTEEELQSAGMTAEYCEKHKDELVQVHVELTQAEKQLILDEWNGNLVLAIRENCIQKIKELRRQRIDAVSPAWNEEAYKYYKLFKNRFVLGTENDQQLRCEAIFDYAKDKIQFCKTALIVDLQAYDPLTDVDFPS